MNTAQKPRHPFVDWPGPIAMAHRGGASDAPENTLPAFQRAFDLGYRYLETDVQVTADGVVVAFHDDDLSRTCDRAGRISELPWREVASARVNGQATIPRLAELFSSWPDARVNIDCKSDHAVEALASELAASNVLDRICIGSFSGRRLRRLRERLGPGLCTSAGPLSIAALRVLWQVVTPYEIAQVPVKWHGITVVNERFVERAHRRGVEVHAWTIDDSAEMDRLLDMGVDGLITDRPAVLKDVLVRRSQWT